MALFTLAATLLLSATGAVRADVLDWATRPLTNINGASDVATVNGVTVTTTGSTAGGFNSNLMQIEPAGASNGTTGFINSTLNATADNETSRQIITFAFSEPVYNVSFTVWDLDGGPNFNDGTNFFNDIVTFTSSGGVPNGTPAAQVTWTPATGRAAATANGGLSGATGNITVTYPGPVTSVTINHIAGAVTGSNNPTNQAIFIEDLTFFKRPQLTLTKVVTNNNGGTSATSAFPLTAAGPSTISGVAGSAAVTNAVLVPGTYSLSETGPTGYNASAWACTAGTLAGANLTLAAGQIATCTITNDDVAPRLTLLKTVTNDNGGTNVDTDFTLTATGPTTITGIEGGATVTNAAVTAGTYTLSESGAATANYTQGTWSCTAGTLTGNSLVLGVGQTASCTITNNDRPRLTLLKTVINDNGGTALDTAFTLTATGPVTISGIEGNAAVTNAAVNAGTYALSESALAGYAGGAWSCVGGTLTGSNLALAQNQNATCTITNNDQPARLTLTKTVVNTGGGTATTTTFPLTAAGPVTITGTSGTAPVTNASVNAGTYVLSEVTNSNYTASAWSCSAGALTGNSLVLALGQTASCSITNTFVPAPALTIVKTANTAGPLLAGQTVTYNYLVTNTGNVTVTGVNVAETAFNGTGIPPVPATGSSTSLLPGQSVSFTAPYLVTQQDVDTLQ